MKALFVSAFALVCGYTVYTSQKEELKLSELTLRNAEALARGEDSKCPDPYDVYDHQLCFSQRTGTFITDYEGSITIMGIKFKLGAKKNTKITLTYELGNCDKPSEGNCCPNSRNGEINIVGYELFE